jgi:hypothetical protein
MTISLPKLWVVDDVVKDSQLAIDVFFAVIFTPRCPGNHFQSNDRRDISFFRRATPRLRNPSGTSLHLRETDGNSWESLWSLEVEGFKGCDDFGGCRRHHWGRRSLSEASENSFILAEIEVLGFVRSRSVPLRKSIDLSA